MKSFYIRHIFSKIFLAAAAILSFSAKPFAQTNGIYESYAILSINGGGNTYYDMAATSANPDFDGASLGSFTSCQSLIVKGGQNKTFKCGGGDIYNGHLYWRVWLTSSGASGSFNQVSMSFVSNDAGGCGGNQTWQGTGGNTNIVGSLSPGNYTLEVYSDADGFPGTVYSSNFGNNYKATFTVTANAGAGSISGPAALCNGSTGTYTNSTSVPAGGTAAWSSSNTGVATIDAATGVATTVAPGTTNIVYTITGGCGGTVSTSLTLAVSEPSTAPTSAHATSVGTCGDVSTLTQSGGVLSAGAYFQWYADAAFTIPVGGANILPDALTVVTPSNTSTYYVRIEGGTAPCAATTSAASVTVVVPHTWLGLLDNNWFNPLNWCGGIPDSTSDVNIPSLLLFPLFYPVISDSTAGIARVHNITIVAGASVTVNGTGVLSLNGSITNSGTLDITAGTLDLAGNNVSVSGSSLLDNSVKDLRISNNASLSVTADDTLKVTNNLYFANVNSKTLATNGNLTFISNAAGTASLQDLTNNGVNSGNAVTGSANVERYISEGRKWRFISSDGTAGVQTIQNSWMEGQTPGTHTNPASNGYGLWITDITGTTGGFDSASYTPSVKTWDGSQYNGISDPTLLNIHAFPAYMAYVRGDRGATGSNATTNSTVLRTKGNLNTYNFPAAGPIVQTALNNSLAIGNPYASAVDLSKIFDNTNFGTTINIQIWDPALTGTYGLGGFQYLTRLGGETDFTITPAGGSYSATAVIVDRLESGQAFFLQSSATNDISLQFTEQSKTPGSHAVFFAPGPAQKLSGKLFIRDSGVPVLTDGFGIHFDPAYNSAADHDDAGKLNTTDENVSVRTNNTLLAVELRKNILPNDTIHINADRLKQRDYEWQFNMSNLDEPGRTGFLVDRFANTSTALNLAGNNVYDFSVTADPSSAAADRFFIVFNPAVVVPVTLVSISATRLADKTVLVKWNAENEIGIDHYELQRSADGSMFNIESSMLPSNNAGGSAAYSLIDQDPLAGNNYYRIKAISNNGRVQYSALVKVEPIGKDISIAVYPNPVIDHVMNLKFSNEPAGKYQLQLSDGAGRVVLMQTMNITEGNEVRSVDLGKTLSGNYSLKIIDPAGKKVVMGVVIDGRW